MQAPVRLLWREPMEQDKLSIQDILEHTKKEVVDLRGHPPIKTWKELEQRARSVFKLVDNLEIAFQCTDGHPANDDSFPGFFEMIRKEEFSLMVVDKARVGTGEVAYAYDHIPKPQVDQLRTLLKNIRFPNAAMELIENSIESIRTAQQHIKDLGQQREYHAQIEIDFDQRNNVIEFRDNGTGMTVNGLERAMAIGARPIRGTGKKSSSPNTSLSTQPKVWTSGNFGNFGIGLKCSFKFGENKEKMVLQIDTKQENAQTMATSIMDYGKMLQENQYKCAVRIQQPDADIYGVGRSRRGGLGRIGSHGTRIHLSNVDSLFWTTGTAGAKANSKWYPGDEFLSELAEKYHFYIHGMRTLDLAFSAAGGLQPPPDTLEPLDILVNGTSLRKLTNRVQGRIESMRMPPQEEESETLLPAGEDGETNGGSSSSASGGVRGCGGEAAAPGEGDANRWRPCWHTKFKVFCRGGGPEGQDCDVAEAHLMLFYKACAGGDEAESDESEDPRQLFVLWQELFLREETLTLGNACGLPFMVQARKNAKGLLLRKAFDRVKGFLFLDDSFEPNPNKMILAPDSRFKHELLEPKSRETIAEYKKILEEYTTIVERWHSSFDRMIDRTTVGQFIILSPSSSLATCYRPISLMIEFVQNFFSDRQKEDAPFAASGESVQVYRWYCLRKTFPAEGGGARGTARRQISTRNSDGSVDYVAPKEDRSGDYIRFRNPEKKNFFICGEIKGFETTREDGENPSRGKVVVAVPFSGEISIDVDFILQNKLSSADWKKHYEDLKSRLPQAMRVEMYDYNSPQSNPLFALWATEGDFDTPLRLTTDMISKLQFRVTLLNKHRRTVIDGSSSLDKKEVVPLKKLKVKFELFDERGVAIMDRNGKPWFELAQPHSISRGAEYCSAIDPFRDEMPLNHWLKAGKFRLRVSVELSERNELQQFLDHNKKTLDRCILIEVNPGWGCPYLIYLYWELAGKPKSLQVRLEDQIWLEDECAATLIFRDAADCVIPPQLLVIRKVTVREKHVGTGAEEDKPLRMIVSAENFCRVTGIVVAGRKITGTNSTVELQLRAWVDWKDQSCFSTSTETNISMAATAQTALMSGLPHAIRCEQGAFHHPLKRHEPVACQISILDLWGNIFTGVADRVTVDFTVRGGDWLHGDRGRDRSGADDINVVPARGLVKGVVELPDQLMARICCPYGTSESLIFECHLRDARQAADAPAASGGDGGDRRLAGRRRGISSSVSSVSCSPVPSLLAPPPPQVIILEQPFQVEKAELRFAFPDELMGLCKVLPFSGRRESIEKAAGVFFELDIDGRSAHALAQVILTTVAPNDDGEAAGAGAGAPGGGELRALKSMRDRALTVTRTAYCSLASVDDAPSVLAEKNFHLSEGRTDPIGAIISVTESSSYVARFDGLTTKLAVRIRAGLPARVDLMTDLTKMEIDIGQPWDLFFQAYDEFGILIDDPAAILVALDCESSALTIESPTPAAAAVADAGVGVFRVSSVLSGQLSFDTDVLTTRVTLGLRSAQVSSGASALPGSSAGGRGKRARPDSATMTTAGECDVRREVAIEVRSGPATRLTFVTRGGAAVLLDGQEVTYISGQSLELGIQAVDVSGNRNHRHNAEVLVSFHPISDEENGDGGSSGGSAVAQSGIKELRLKEGYVDLGQIPWQPDLVSIDALTRCGRCNIYAYSTPAVVGAARNQGGRRKQRGGSDGRDGDDELDEAVCRLIVTAGGWQDKVEVIEGDDWDGERFVLDDSTPTLGMVRVRVTAHSGAMHIGSRVELTVYGEKMECTSASADGTYEFKGCRVPLEAGTYEASLDVLNAQGPPCRGRFNVERTPGTPASIVIGGHQNVFLRHGSSDLTVSISVRNRCGITMSPEVLSAQGYTTNFELKEPHPAIQVVIRSTASIRSETAYKLRLVEIADSADTLQENWNSSIVAVLRCPGENPARQRNSSVAPANVVEVRSERAVTFHYVPESQVRGQHARMDQVRQRIAMAEQEKSAIEKEIMAFEEQTRHVAVQERSLEARDRLLRQTKELQPLIQRIMDEAKSAAGRAGRIAGNLNAQAGSVLDVFLRDKSAGQLPPKVKENVVGVMAELGQVDGHAGGLQAKRWVEGIAALAGRAMQAVVVRSEEASDIMDKIPKYRGLNVLVLAPPQGIQVEPDGRIRLRRPPDGAFYAVNLLEMDPGAEALRAEAWYHVLHDDLIFLSEESMERYKQQRGRTHRMACQRDSGEGQGTWRIVPKGQITRAGDAAHIVATVGMIVEGKQTQEYRDKEAELTNLQKELSDRTKLNEELRNLVAQKGTLQQPPGKRKRRLAELSEEINKLTAEWKQLSPSRVSTDALRYYSL